MALTKIEWCDYSFNPWIGCTKVSPGCANCYAEGESKRFGWAQWGKGKERQRTSEAYWKRPLQWNRDAAACSINGFPRPRVFCASLADWLDDEVPLIWLANLLAMIPRTPNLDWLLLTKRPENFFNRVGRILRELFPESQSKMFGSEIIAEAEKWLIRWTIGGQAPDNVWIGTSVEDQKRADERIPLLLEIPAKVRFLSCEPLLGPVFLCKGCPGCPGDCGWTPGTNNYGIHWVIIGGESGPKARPCNIDWIRAIACQCQWANVPVFVKQLGRIPSPPLYLKDRKGGDMAEWPEDLRIREFPRI